MQSLDTIIRHEYNRDIVGGESVEQGVDDERRQ
jgi:hypothetical protein